MKERTTRTVVNDCHVLVSFLLLVLDFLELKRIGFSKTLCLVLLQILGKKESKPL